MSKKNRQKSSGEELFNEYFSGLYKGRWSDLSNALQDETQKIALDILEGASATEPYELDQASVMAADTLPVVPGDQVLDMCAAPGGKSLVLMAKLKGEGLLVSNEYSKSRLSRLKRVMGEYTPESWKPSIEIKNHDATKWGLFQKDVYDAVLIDAPCSGERHLLENKKELKVWTAKRSQNLATRQYALLCSGVLAAKSGAYILYSTCSINPVENDKVIEKFLKKKKTAEVIPIEKDLGEPTEYGWQVFPDTGDGWGPLYFCLLKKN